MREKEIRPHQLSRAQKRWYLLDKMDLRPSDVTWVWFRPALHEQSQTKEKVETVNLVSDKTAKSGSVSGQKESIESPNESLAVKCKSPFVHPLSPNPRACCPSRLVYFQNLTRAPNKTSKRHRYISSRLRHICLKPRLLRHKTVLQIAPHGIN